MIKKNNSIIKINDKDDINFLLKACIFINWFLVIMMYGAQFKAKTRAGDYFWIMVIIAAVGLTIWGVVLAVSKKPLLLPQRFALFFGISSLAYSMVFFWLFYETIYKMILLSSPIYLIIGILGYIVVVMSALFYRFKVYKGVYKDRAGMPNQSVLISITAICILVSKVFLDKTKVEIRLFFLGILMLLVSYVFSLGVSQLFDYWIFIKSKKG